MSTIDKPDTIYRWNTAWNKPPKEDVELYLINRARRTESVGICKLLLIFSVILMVKWKSTIGAFSTCQSHNVVTIETLEVLFYPLVFHHDNKPEATHPTYEMITLPVHEQDHRDGSTDLISPRFYIGIAGH